VGAALLSGNNRARNAAIGAAACGGAGAAYGYYVDKQEAALRQRLQGTGVQVKRQGDNLYLIMPGDITFATDSYQIDSHFYPVLNSVATVLKKFDESNISVEGYTDSTGSFEYNQVLSEKRANSVASYLISQGVASDRIAAFGRGERNPVASNKTASGRASNRRVEISIKPRG
jgi:outer membrane protein OmpA-like peptidoglycan-associated protein